MQDPSPAPHRHCYLFRLFTTGLQRPSTFFKASPTLTVATRMLLAYEAGSFPAEPSQWGLDVDSAVRRKHAPNCSGTRSISSIAHINHSSISSGPRSTVTQSSLLAHSFQSRLIIAPFRIMYCTSTCDLEQSRHRGHVHLTTKSTSADPASKPPSWWSSCYPTRFHLDSEAAASPSWCTNVDR